MTAILSDVHGNSPALRAVLDDIARAGAEEIIFLGDVVNGVDGGTCIELLLDAGVICIRGNAEENVCTDDIESFPWATRLHWEWVIPAFCFYRDQLFPGQLDAIRDWPSELIREEAWIIHDSPASRLDFPGKWDGLPSQYATLAWHGDAMPCGPNDPGWSDQSAIAIDRGVQIVFCGHSHVPCFSGTQSQKGSEICANNVGSAGMPLDGDPRACWASWEGDSVELHRTEYDVEEIIALVDSDGRPHPQPKVYREMFRQGRHWREIARELGDSENP